MPKAIHHLRVAPQLFALAVDAIRLHSLQIGRLSSINAAAAWGASLSLERELCRQSLIPMMACADTAGPIRLHLAINERWAPDYHAAVSRFEELLGHRVIVRQTCCLFFQMVVLRVTNQSDSFHLLNGCATPNS